jgi:hypothetical protein
MKTYKKICLNCKTEFETKMNKQTFCKRSCYYQFNAERIKANIKVKKKGKSFPIYKTESGKEIQLDFEPMSDYNRFLEFKEKNP